MIFGQAALETTLLTKSELILGYRPLGSLVRSPVSDVCGDLRGGLEKLQGLLNAD